MEGPRNGVNSLVEFRPEPPRRLESEPRIGSKREPSLRDDLVELVTKKNDAAYRKCVQSVFDAAQKLYSVVSGLRLQDQKVMEVVAPIYELLSDKWLVKKLPDCISGFSDRTLFFRLKVLYDGIPYEMEKIKTEFADLMVRSDNRSRLFTHSQTVS